MARVRICCLGRVWFVYPRRDSVLDFSVASLRAAGDEFRRKKPQDQQDCAADEPDENVRVTDECVEVGLRKIAVRRSIVCYRPLDGEVFNWIWGALPCNKVSKCSDAVNYFEDAYCFYCKRSLTKKSE